LSWTGADEYKTAARNFALGEVGTALRAATAALRYGTIRVEVVPGKDLHGPSWEALLELALTAQLSEKPLSEMVSTGKREAPHRRQLRCRRISGFSANMQMMIKQPRLVSIACDQLGERIVSHAWSGAKRVDVKFTGRPRGLGSSEPLGDVLDRSTRSAVELLHVIGPVEEVSAGPAFLIGSDDVRGERVITADDIARAFGGLQLAVLQGKPLRSWEPRLQEDRRGAMSLRAFAGALFNAGVGGVLVIPRLETEVAAEALSQFAALLKSRMRAFDLLARYAARFERLVHQRVPLDLDAREELVLDLCCYASPWNQRLLSVRPSPKLEESNVDSG
jgi:hypothetical protein